MKKKGIHITLLVILSLALLFSCSSRITMPNLVKRSTSEAKETMLNSSDDIKITFVDITNSNRSESSGNWIVCEQSHPEGKKIGGSENVTLSFGRTQKECDSKEIDQSITVPDVTGLTVSKAEGKLKEVSPDINIVREDAVKDTQRSIWDSDNWIVCSHSPEGGSIGTLTEEVTLTFARDKGECESKIITSGSQDYIEPSRKSSEPQESEKVTEEEVEEQVYEEEALTTGLTHSTAKQACIDRFESVDFERTPPFYQPVDLHSFIGESYGVLNDEWFIKIDADIEDKIEGTMVCRVSGTEDDPQINHLGLNVPGIDSIVITSSY